MARIGNAKLLTYTASNQGFFSRVVGSGLGDVRDLRANQGC